MRASVSKTCWMQCDGTTAQGFLCHWVINVYWWWDRTQKQPDEFLSVWGLYFLFHFKISVVIGGQFTIEMDNDIKHTDCRSYPFFPFFPFLQWPNHSLKTKLKIHRHTNKTNAYKQDILSRHCYDFSSRDMDMSL